MTRTIPEPSSPPPPQTGGCGRWILGCGASLLVFLAIAGGLAWWFVGRPVIAAWQSVQQIERLGPLEARVANRRAFAPPADGLLAEAQVQRFLAAQQQMERELTWRVERLERLADEFDGRRPGGLEVFTLADTYVELLGLVREALEQQSAALDAQDFSAGEYAWVRWEVLRALGIGGVIYDVDAFASAFTGDAESQRGPRPAGDAVPEANRALVERYRDALEATAAVAAFGL